MKSKNINIRIAKLDDIAIISEFDSDPSWDRKSLENEFKTSFSTIYIAEIKNEITGFSVIWNIVDEIQLNRILIKKNYRRKGIATELINYIINFWNNDNYKKILLEVNANSTAAMLFYKSMDFIQTGIRKDYYKDGDAILMEKLI